MPGKINAAELDPTLRAQLLKRAGKNGRRAPVRSMTIDQVRTHALRVLAVIADLTPAGRTRVLRHAGKLNEV